MQRLPVAKVTGATILGKAPCQLNFFLLMKDWIGWGVIMITTPACKNFAGIAVNRFLLGVLEGFVNPSFVLLLSIWYATAEQPIRLESYYCTNGIATMFGGLIGYAVGHITSGLPQWMYVFLIFGSLSTLWGIIFLLVCPDLPSTARFLSPAERILAVKRVANNKQSIKNAKFSMHQAWQTALDPKTWMLVIMGESTTLGLVASILTSTSRRRANPQRSPFELHQSRDPRIRLLNAEFAIPANTRRCCPRRQHADRWLHMLALP